MYMFKPIDYLLDRITMYRLLLYYLIVLVAAATGFSALGILQYNPVTVGGSALYLVAICWISNKVFAYVFETPANIESSLITALILSLIITPLDNLHNALFLSAAGILAIASKYILAIKKKHIFNPAAVAVVLTSFGAHQAASWWVGTTAMLPLVIAGGLLVIRKVQRVQMVLIFYATAFLSIGFFTYINNGDVLDSLQRALLHSSLFFLAYVMLTEPFTSPVTGRSRAWYAALVGLIFSPQAHILGIYSTPELALIVGNIYAFIVNPKVKLTPHLTKRKRIGADVVDFVFGLKKPMSYKPGQYMEWTLAHQGADARGNRRYFTLASSPTEDNLRLGVKFYPEGSTFKQAMLQIDNHTLLAASNLGGDFVLPDNASRKLAFIAGGIGVTPYRSMIKYLLDTNDLRDITLLYSEKKPEDIVYRNVFDQAVAKLGIKVVYTLTESAHVPADWQGRTGIISEHMIKAEVPDYLERVFYISGPQPMVSAMKHTLRSLGVSRHQIKTDFFPGYA
ncbi:MAG TPA: RnfABCDGE type electron transport complex subunit D [Candidatus Saccharimonadales bacterium]|nr:RnfABCDGE type electron transport complex subunit D [Candidatus Saccharimonadales bacterium]